VVSVPNYRKQGSDWENPSRKVTDVGIVLRTEQPIDCSCLSWFVRDFF